MAGPIGAASMGLSLGGSIIGAEGAALSGKAKQQMYNYQAGLAEFRKRIALQNRDYALQVGEDQTARYGLKARQEIGTIRARQGASGIDVGSGSPVQVRGSQRQIAQMDMATIRNNAARRAYGYEVEAATEEAQAGMYTSAAKWAKVGSEFDVASSLISGATSVSSKWLQGQQAGLWS